MFPQEYRQRVVDCVYREGKLDCTDQGVYDCRIKLRGIFEARRPGVGTFLHHAHAPPGSNHPYQRGEQHEDQTSDPSRPPRPLQEPQQQEQRPQNELISSGNGNNSESSGTHQETSHQVIPSSARMTRPTFPTRQDSLRSVTSSASNDSNVNTSSYRLASSLPARGQREQAFISIKNDEDEDEEKETESTAESQRNIENTLKRQCSARNSSSPPKKKGKPSPRL